MEIKIRNSKQGLELITSQIVSSMTSPVVISIQGPLELGVDGLVYDTCVNLERAGFKGWVGTTDESQNIVKLAEINTADLQYCFIKDTDSTKRIIGFSQYFLRRSPDFYILLANPFEYSRLNEETKTNLKKGVYNLIIEGNPRYRLQALLDKDFFIDN